jgi:aerobic carbon-monoxide dehydrogenase medium subunit
VDYVAPVTLDDAYDALEAPDAQCLAGGQSLVAMMNLGLATPGRLVSLRRIAQLHGVTSAADGGLRIGAMTTHAELARLEVAAPGPDLIARTARAIAYPAVRTRGTIGGSVALNDPAADYPVALVAAEAILELVSRDGTRRVPATEFFRGLFDTALVRGEIVAAIHVPGGPERGGAAYEKLSLVAGDFAILSVAAIAAERVQLSVGGYAMKPLRLAGIDASDDALLAVGRQLAAENDPPSDHRASAAYRRRVVPELIRRAGMAAIGRR